MNKVFEINGKLIVEDAESHQEMLEQLYRVLQSNGFYFYGVTREVTNDK